MTSITEKSKKDFCMKCRKETEYLLQKRDLVKNIRNKEYTFGITVAICAECGEEMSIPGLIDKNVQEINEQYRTAESLVSIDDIERLMKIYKKGDVTVFTSGVPIGISGTTNMIKVQVV